MSPKRKNIPVGIRLQACLRLLGFAPGEEPEWDHFPALARRAVNEDGTDWVPAQLDPEYIRPMRKHDHLQKTTGKKGTSKLSSDGNGDTTQAAKIKRIIARRADSPELTAALKILLQPEERLKPKQSYTWPSGRKIASRGFKKR
jgi:hypothetical protein